MTCLVLGAGLVGSQIARILVERGERPVLMDRAPQPQAIGAIVDLAGVTLAEGDVLQPLALARVIREHRIAKEVLGYAPRYSMREAVRDLAAWLKRQPLPTP